MPERRVQEGGVSAAVSAAKDSPSFVAVPGWTRLQKAAPKLPQETKGSPCSAGSGSEGLKQQHQGDVDASLELSRDLLLSSRSATVKGSVRPGSSKNSLCQTEGLPSVLKNDQTYLMNPSAREFEGSPLPLEGKSEAKQSWITPARKPALGKSCCSPSPSNCALEADSMGCTGSVPENRLKSNANNCFQVHRHSEELEYRVCTASLGQKEEEQQQQRVTEATVCAKNSKVSSTGEKVVLWTRYICLNCIIRP